jgi:hypothetical protein
VVHIWSGDKPGRRYPYCIIRESSDEGYELEIVYPSGLKARERFDEIAAARQRADEWWKIWRADDW